MAVILPRSAKLNRRAAASGKVTSNARRIGASATPAPDRKLGCSGCAVVGQLRDAFAQNRFLSFALSQTPRQIQRYAHLILYSPRNVTPPHPRCATPCGHEKSVPCARSSDRTDPE